MKIILTLLLFSVVLSLNAQKKYPPSVIDSFANEFQTANLYLQTDREVYIVNDLVHLGITVLNAKRKEIINDSVYVKVSFLNSSNYVLDSFYIRVNHGKIKFTQRLGKTTGKLKVRAVLMTDEIDQNKIWYEKTFIVLDQFKMDINWNIQFNKKVYHSFDSLELKLNVSHFDGIPLKYWTVNCGLKVNGSYMFYPKQKSDSNGSIYCKLDLREYSPGSNVNFEFSVNIGSKNYQKSVQIPIKDSLAKILFFPESGALIAGVENLIAFKGIDFSGSPIDFSGQVLSESNDVQIEIRTTHDGRGQFKLIPKAGVNYFARIFSGNGKYLDHPLPKVVQHTIGIHVISIDSNGLNFKISNMPDSGLKLLLRKGFETVEVMKLFGSDVFHIDLKKYKCGIHQLMLFDDNWNYLCERTLFLRPDKRMNLKVEFNQEKYVKGDTVRIKVLCTDEYGMPLKANLNLNVLGGKGHESLLPKSNLLSSIYLENELKSRLKHAAYYFESTDSIHLNHLDIILMTEENNLVDLKTMQQYIESNVDAVFHPSELNYVISGSLFKRFIPAEYKDKLKLICLNNRMEIPLNKRGEFAIYGLKKGEMLKFKATAGSVYSYTFEVLPWQVFNLTKFKKEAVNYRSNCKLFSELPYQMKHETSDHEFNEKEYSDLIFNPWVFNEEVEEENKEMVCRIRCRIGYWPRSIKIGMIDNQVYGYRPMMDKVENHFEFDAIKKNDLFQSDHVRKNQRDPYELFDVDIADLIANCYFNNEFETNNVGEANLEFVNKGGEMVYTCLIEALSDNNDVGMLKVPCRSYTPFVLNSVSVCSGKNKDTILLPIDMSISDSTLEILNILVKNKTYSIDTVIEVVCQKNIQFKLPFCLDSNERDVISLEVKAGNYKIAQSLYLGFDSIAYSKTYQPVIDDTYFKVYADHIKENINSEFHSYIYRYDSTLKLGYSFDNSNLNVMYEQTHQNLAFFGANFSNKTLNGLVLKLTFNHDIRIDSSVLKQYGVKKFESTGKTINLYLFPIQAHSSLCMEIPFYLLSDKYSYDIAVELADSGGKE